MMFALSPGQAPCFKSKFITAELAHLFSQSDTEEEFEGFSEDEEEEDGARFNKRRKTKVGLLFFSLVVLFEKSLKTRLKARCLLIFSF